MTLFLSKKLEGMTAKSVGRNHMNFQGNNSGKEDTMSPQEMTTHLARRASQKLRQSAESPADFQKEAHILAILKESALFNTLTESEIVTLTRHLSPKVTISLLTH